MAIEIVPQSHLNGHQTDANARLYIEALLAGNKPDKPDVGRYKEPVVWLEDAFDTSPSLVQVVLHSLIETGKYGLQELLFGSPAPAQSSFQLPPEQQSNYPELPPEIKAYEVRANEASPILDAIIEFFRYWSTRSYDGYHEGVAIWILSTIAARRVVLPWQDGIWTPLYILLVAGSTTHAKTKAASYGRKIIEDAGLGFLLSPDEITPQKLLHNMAGQSVPRNYSTKDNDGKEYIRLQKAFSGQRGWIYDEFGNKLQEIISAKGYANLLYSLLKQLYDCKRDYRYDTLRGSEEEIDMPYLSIIGTATPACLKPIMGTKSSMWTDGTAARLSFIVPPRDELKLQSAPNETCIVPAAIIHALQSWHQRLGIPSCQIIDTAEQEAMLEQALGEEKSPKKKKENNNRPAFEVEKGDLPQTIVYMSREVYQAQDEYYKALATLARDNNLDERFTSHYGRLPEKALRVAMLLASLENCSHIDMRHWGRGQVITEHWRRDFHELIAQVSSEVASGHGAIEDKVLEVITTKLDGKMATSYTIARLGGTLLRKAGTEEVRKAGDELAAVNLIQKEGQGKAAMYGMREEK